jgi:RHS repeat-associated protein
MIYPTPLTSYYHGDYLGSERLMTSENGYPVWSSTFLPFGQEWNPQITVNHYKFTGKERDSESGLDNFGARYDSSQYGRFMTPDPDNAGSLEEDPQSWNGYAYARNNPLNLTDPEGLSYSVCITDTDGTKHCTTYGNDSDFYQAVHDSPGASFDSGNSGNIYADGVVVGQFSHSGNGSSDTVATSDDPIIFPTLLGAAGGAVKAAFRAGASFFGGLLGAGSDAAAGAARGAAGETAAQAAVRTAGVIDRVFQTSVGPVRVYCEVTVEGTTAVVRDLAIYPADSEGALNVGYTQMRQGLRVIQGDLKEAGFTDMRVENAYRVGGATPGRTTTFTVKLK